MKIPTPTKAVEDLLYWWRVDKVRRIIDGDTIVCDIDLGFHQIWRERSVRFYGVQAPELHSDVVKAMKAKTRVEEFVVSSSGLLLRSFKNKDDKFGRVLAEVHGMIDGQLLCLNDILIEERLAIRYML